MDRDYGDQRRNKRHADKLIYTTRPAPFSGDGKMSVVTVVWEKVKWVFTKVVSKAL